MLNVFRKVAKPTTAIPQVPWSPLVGFVVVIGAFFLSQIAAGIVISIIWYAVLHPGEKTTDDQFSDWLTNSTGAQFAIILITEILAIGAIYMLLRSYRLNFAAIGLGRPKLKHVGYGILAVPVYFTMYVIIVAIASQLLPGLDVDQAQEIGFENVHGLIALSLTFISLVILPPLAEEIMVRGALYSSLRKGLPLFFAVTVTSFMFAIAHLPAGGEAGPLYIAAIDTFILSLVLIYLREKSGSLWPCITLHAIKNGIAFTALFILHIS